MLNGSSHHQANHIKEDQNSKSDSSYTALHRAAIAGDDATVEALLSSGADRTTKDLKHGNTALHEAAWRGYSRCVKVLCSMPKIQRKTSKKFGRKVKNVDVVNSELNIEVYLSTPNAGGFSALHLSAQNGHNQSCRELLLAGANPDVQNNYGDTPLHTACRYGHAGATRILLSAKCDPVSVNLNYDTPLHISVAMGRRKLTRILYEVCGLSGVQLKNAQGEAARDIALRKNLKPIIEILNAPPTNTSPDTADDVDSRPIKRNQCRSSGSTRNHTSDNSDKAKNTKKATDEKFHDPHVGNNPEIWSPYGCHYFPDPRTFPSPKLETLPKEPLKYGEQYFLDLAGNIRKGPIGIGNTCYCGPFFSHIEQQINQNKKSFKKYVLKATGKLDGKVQELAIQTDDKIQRIARSILAEQGRDKYSYNLENWPRRSDPLRATVVPQISKGDKDEPNNNSLSRCRSLELLGDKKFSVKSFEAGGKTNLHRSFDLLNHTEQHEAIIHHSMMTDFDTSKSSSMQQSTNTSESERKFEYENNHLRASSKYSLDFREKRNASTKERTLTDDGSLENFTTKTKEIIQVKRATRRRLKEKTLSELHDRQQMLSAFPKLSIGRPDTNTADDIELSSIGNRSPYKYPNDFDNISIEMRNITKLLGSSIEPLESAPSTSSSFYQSNNKMPPIEIEHDDFSEKSDDESAPKQFTGTSMMSNPGKALNLLSHGGFFQNTCFENQSSSSCNTLKSVELPKADGARSNDEYHDDDDETDQETDHEVKSQPDSGSNTSQHKYRSSDLSKSNSEQEVNASRIYEHLSLSTKAQTNGNLFETDMTETRKRSSLMPKYILPSAANLRPSSSTPTIKSPLAMNYTLSTIGQTPKPSAIATDISTSVFNLEPLKPLLRVPLSYKQTDQQRRSFLQNTHHLPQINSNGIETFSHRFNALINSVNNNSKLSPNHEQTTIQDDQNSSTGSTPNTTAKIVHKATIHSPANHNHYENSEDITQST